MSDAAMSKSASVAESGPTEVSEVNNGWSWLDFLTALAFGWRLLIAIPVIVGALAYGISLLLPPVYTARTVFLAPQQQQTATASAIASLGALTGLATGAASMRNPADQYVALMQSAAVSDRVIDKFDLMKVYDEKLRAETRKRLAQDVRVGAGKKDGLITVEVDSHDSQRAAAIANAHVDELRRLTNALALTEAQQRRAFFELQMQGTRDSLVRAQVALQGSGFTPGALRAEPKTAAEGYAKLRAEVTAAEVRFSTLRNRLAESAPEMQQQRAELNALRTELARMEERSDARSASDSDYIGKYREFKYQETLFDLFSKQYEMARLDEAREGTLIQVVDVASPPERRSRPRRFLIALFWALAAFVSCGVVLGLRHWWRSIDANPAYQPGLVRLRQALHRT